MQFAEPNYIVTTQAVSADPAYTGGQLWGWRASFHPGERVRQPGRRGGAGGGLCRIDQSRGRRRGLGIDYTHPDLYLNVWLNPREISATLKAQLTDADADGLITFRDLNNAANAALVSDLNKNGRIDAGDLLQDSRWENGVDEDGNGYKDDLIGWDFVNNDNDPYDDHSRTCARVEARSGATASNTGVVGVTWSTQIHAPSSS